MAPSRVPSSSTCSRSIPVITVSAPSTAFTASRRPPSPISSTAGRAPRREKCSSAASVSHSKCVRRARAPRRSRRLADDLPEGPRGDLRAAQPDALADAHQVRRGVQAGRVAGRQQHRLEKRRRRALALGPGDDHRGERRAAGSPSRASARRIGPRPNFHPKRIWRCRNDSASTKRMPHSTSGILATPWGRSRLRKAAVRASRRPLPACCGARCCCARCCRRPGRRGASEPHAGRRVDRGALVARRGRLQRRRPGRGAAPVRRGALERRAARPQLELRRRRALRAGRPLPGARGVPQGARARPARRARPQQPRHRPGAARGLRGRRGGLRAGGADRPAYPVTQRNLGILHARRLEQPGGGPARLGAATSSWRRTGRTPTRSATSSAAAPRTAAAARRRSPRVDPRAGTLVPFCLHWSGDAGHAHHLRPVRVLRHRPRRAGRRQHDRRGQPERRGLPRHRAGRADRPRRLDAAPGHPLGGVLGRLPRRRSTASPRARTACC